MSNPSSSLTLEQQFSLRSFETQVNQMSREQAQKYLVELYGMMLCREAMWKSFAREQWSIEAPPMPTIGEVGSDG